MFQTYTCMIKVCICKNQTYIYTFFHVGISSSADCRAIASVLWV